MMHRLQIKVRQGLEGRQGCLQPVAVAPGNGGESRNPGKPRKNGPDVLLGRGCTAGKSAAKKKKKMPIIIPAKFLGCRL